MLIGEYDESIDMGMQIFQQDIVDIIVTLESNLDNGKATENTYKHFEGKYTNMKKNTANLKIRCSGLPKYSEVYDQILLIEHNLETFEKYHKLGFVNKEEIAPLKKAFEVQFTEIIKLQNRLKKRKK